MSFFKAVIEVFYCVELNTFSFLDLLPAAFHLLDEFRV